MKKYDYLSSVEKDVKSYIDSNISFEDYSSLEELESYLNDVLFVTDSVTGNGSGSYTFNAFEAEENICHNSDLLEEALSEFGEDSTFLSKGAEACDVTIRCYILPIAISEVLNEMELDFDN